MLVGDIHTQNWQMSLDAPDTVVEGVDDIRQCVDTLLKTRKGEDPLRPHFGCGLFDWIDKPNTTAIPNMKKEILDAITTYETRIIVTGITHEFIEGGVKFNINYKSPDGRSGVFEFVAGQINLIGSGITAPSMLSLSASYSPGAFRYVISLALDGNNALPPIPDGGFDRITNMFAWLKDNWYIYGTWYWLVNQNKIVVYVPSRVALSGTLNIQSRTNVLSASIPAITDPNGYYFIDFKDNNGQQILPVTDGTINTVESLLSFVAANYGIYGDWTIQDSTLTLNGSVDLTGFTLDIQTEIFTPSAFTEDFTTGFLA